MLTVIIYPFVTSLQAEYLGAPYRQFPVFVYCFLKAVPAGSWVLLCHAALHPKNLTKNEKYLYRMRQTRRSICYTVIFSVAMCCLAFVSPVLAVCLTALAWVAYMVMGIVLTPLEEGS